MPSYQSSRVGLSVTEKVTLFEQERWVLELRLGRRDPASSPASRITARKQGIESRETILERFLSKTGRNKILGSNYIQSIKGVFR